MKKVFILFSFLTVFTVVSVSAGNMPLPKVSAFENLKTEMLQKEPLATTQMSWLQTAQVSNVKIELLSESELPKLEVVDCCCTSTTTCRNGGGSFSVTMDTCAQGKMVIVAWLQAGGCK